MGEATPPSISGRLRVAEMATRHSTYGPTPNLERSLAIAEEDLESLREALREAVDVELPRLQQRAAEAGAPWSPGRTP